MICIRNIEEVNRGADWAKKRLSRNTGSFNENKTDKYAISAAATCSSFAYNDKIKTDRKGNSLIADRRSFYEGACMAFKSFVEKRTEEKKYKNI